jgi:hypothetical protein
VVKCDVRDCFYSIDRPAALEVLHRYVTTASHRRLLATRFRYQIEHEGKVHSLRSGIPVEEPSSHLVANAYLAQIDRWAVSELAVPHIRFVDDMRFFCRSAEEANSVLKAVRETLALRFGLQLNGEKSSTSPLAGRADASGASDLLRDLKARTEEPLEGHCLSYRRVAIDEVLDAWNRIHEAIVSETFDEVAVDANLDFLAGLRPLPEAGEFFWQLMSGVLAKTCRIQGVSRPVRVRLAGIAMQHMRYADRNKAAERFKECLCTDDGAISKMAFSNLVKCETQLARQSAEEKIVRESAAGNHRLARALACDFVRAFGVTARLRIALGSSPDWETRMLVSGPVVGGDDSMDLVIADLRSLSPMVRRNAALRLATPGDWPSKAVHAWREALRAERNRDARLALLLACKLSGNETRLRPPKKYQLPRTGLELAVSQNAGCASAALPGRGAQQDCQDDVMPPLPGREHVSGYSAHIRVDGGEDPLGGQ